MKAIAINGSPRKDWNTAKLLGKALEGAASAGAETEMILATDTLQFDDYSKYRAGMFNVEAKQRRHAEEFPKTLEEAYELGRRLAGK